LGLVAARRLSATNASNSRLRQVEMLNLNGITMYDSWLGRSLDRILFIHKLEKDLENNKSLVGVSFGLFHAIDTKTFALLRFPHGDCEMSHKPHSVKSNKEAAPERNRSWVALQALAPQEISILHSEIYAPLLALAACSAAAKSFSSSQSALIMEKEIAKLTPRAQEKYHIEKFLLLGQ
jgi:hypothetical protein